MMSSLNVVQSQAVLLSIISYLSVINAIINVTDFNNRVPSLYEQLCCLDNNRGEVFVITDDDETIKCIFCPREIPSTCNAYNDYLTSCSAMLKLFPKAKSGYYNITPSTTNNTITVYCDMEGDNCDGGGGWTRIAYLNMNDSAQQCPPEFTLYNENGIRSCCRQEANDCQSAEYPSNGVSYSRVVEELSDIKRDRLMHSVSFVAMVLIKPLLMESFLQEITQQNMYGRLLLDFQGL